MPRKKIIETVHEKKTRQAKYQADYYLKKRQRIKDLLLIPSDKISKDEQDELDKLYKKYVIKTSTRFVPLRGPRVNCLQTERRHIELNFD
tara:strand:- start:198 stop:467 length:270 start_codon:yes stop_codon:yes gene_type:complete